MQRKRKFHQFAYKQLQAALMGRLVSGRPINMSSTSFQMKVPMFRRLSLTNPFSNFINKLVRTIVVTLVCLTMLFAVTEVTAAHPIGLNSVFTNPSSGTSFEPALSIGYLQAVTSTITSTNTTPTATLVITSTQVPLTTSTSPPTGTITTTLPPTTGTTIPTANDLAVQLKWVDFWIAIPAALASIIVALIGSRIGKRNNGNNNFRRGMVGTSLIVISPILTIGLFILLAAIFLPNVSYTSSGVSISGQDDDEIAELIASVEVLEARYEYIATTLPQVGIVTSTSDPSSTGIQARTSTDTILLENYIELALLVKEQEVALGQVKQDIQQLQEQQESVWSKLWVQLFLFSAVLIVFLYVGGRIILNRVKHHLSQQTSISQSNQEQHG